MFTILKTTDPAELAGPAFSFQRPAAHTSTVGITGRWDSIQHMAFDGHEGMGGMFTTHAGKRTGLFVPYGTVFHTA